MMDILRFDVPAAQCFHPVVLKGESRILILGVMGIDTPSRRRPSAARTSRLVDRLTGLVDISSLGDKIEQFPDGRRRTNSQKGDFAFRPTSSVVSAHELLILTPPTQLKPWPRPHLQEEAWPPHLHTGGVSAGGVRE